MPELGARMRRTTALVIALGAVLATTGVAIAGERDDGPARPAAVPVAAAPAKIATDAAEGAGLERIGTLEHVNQVLDYVSPRREATFHYPGASYLKMHFSRLLLAEGDYVTVADPANKEVHRITGTGP